MSMTRFDEIQFATLVAFTNPESPLFLRAMSDLRALSIQKEYDNEAIHRSVLAILNSKEIEDDLRIREQLENAEVVHKKYLEDYAAYQAEIKQKELEDLNLDPIPLKAHIKAEESKLLIELKEVTEKLENLAKIHQGILEKSQAIQKTTFDNLKPALEDKEITLDNGQAKKLNEQDAERLANAVVSQSYDPNRIVAQVPGLAATDKVMQQQNADKMCADQVVMGELRMLAEMAVISSGNENAMIRPSDIKKRLGSGNNKAVLDTALNKVKEQVSEVKKINVEAIENSKTCLLERKKTLENQIAENAKKLEEKETLKNESTAPKLTMDNKTSGKGN